jgi:hypothetical protein
MAQQLYSAVSSGSCNSGWWGTWLDQVGTNNKGMRASLSQFVSLLIVMYRLARNVASCLLVKQMQQNILQSRSGLRITLQLTWK